MGILWRTIIKIVTILVYVTSVKNNNQAMKWDKWSAEMILSNIRLQLYQNFTHFIVLILAIIVWLPLFYDSSTKPKYSSFQLYPWNTLIPISALHTFIKQFLLLQWLHYTWKKWMATKQYLHACGCFSVIFVSREIWLCLVSITDFSLLCEICMKKKK